MFDYHRVNEHLVGLGAPSVPSYVGTWGAIVGHSAFPENGLLTLGRTDIRYPQVLSLPPDDPRWQSQEELQEIYALARRVNVVGVGHAGFCWDGPWPAVATPTLLQQ